MNLLGLNPFAFPCVEASLLLAFRPNQIYKESFVTKKERRNLLDERLFAQGDFDKVQASKRVRARTAAALRLPLFLRTMNAACLTASTGISAGEVGAFLKCGGPRTSIVTVLALLRRKKMGDTYAVVDSFAGHEHSLVLEFLFFAQGLTSYFVSFPRIETKLSHNS